jgi:circadian clock protein KaiC
MSSGIRDPLVPTGLPELDTVLGGGYPNKSTILLVGPPGMGREALGYSFAASGLASGDFCLYVTRLAVSEVKEDIGAFGTHGGPEPMWIAEDGGQAKCDVSDLAGLSVNIKEALRSNAGGRRVRVVSDVLSSLLMLNQPETVYRFLSQLFSELKKYDLVLIATLEEGMHQPQVVAAMEQLFDGVMVLSLHEEGLKVRPLLRIRKMRGLPPQPGYYLFSFVGNKMKVIPFVR